MFSSVIARSQLARSWPWCAVVAALLFAGFIRWRMLEMPLERDEGEYAYAGQLLLQGVPAYRMAYNMKFPGTYLAYAAMLKVFGETVRGVHLGLILTTSLSTILIFLLGRRLVNAVAGVGAAWTFALLSVNVLLMGLAGHATHFVVLFSSLGMWLVLDAVERGGNWRVLGAGCAFGVAILMKQHAALFAVLGLGYLLWPVAGDRSRTWWERIRRGLVFGVGCGVPLALVCVWLWQAGVFDRFIYWTFGYAQEYVAVPLAKAPAVFKMMAGACLSPSWGLWALSGAGLVCGGMDVRFRRVTAFLGVWLALGFLSICPGFRFRNHYFLMLVPPVAMLAGLMLGLAVDWLKRTGPVRVVAGILVSGFLLAHLSGARNNWQVWFESSPVEASQKIYRQQGCAEAEEVARYIRAHSAPEAAIAVLGSEPQIYFLAQRRSATGYIYAYPMMAGKPYARQMQEDMIRELEKNHPQYVVFVDIPVSWLARPYSDRSLFDWWQKYSAAHYDVAGLVEVSPDGKPVVHWDEALANYARVHPFAFLIFRLRAGAAEARAPVTQ